MKNENKYLINIGNTYLKKNLEIFNSIPNNKNGYKEGVTNLMAILGAYYSLYKILEILPHIDADKEVDFWQVAEEGKNLADSIINNNLQKLKCHNSWFAGYYLNSAGQRISVAFEHLLKLYLSIPPDEHINIETLVNCLINKCKSCDRSGEKCVEILKGFKDKFDPKIFQNSDKTPKLITENAKTEIKEGKFLRFVTSRVNVWKHVTWPKKIDLLPRRNRWWITCFALEEVLLHSNECLRKRLKTE